MRKFAGETRSDARVASEGPRATGKNAFPHRRARACPSPGLAQPNDRGGNPLGCACGIRGPPRYGEKTSPFTVGRGPVPRQASRNPTIAGDRPPRYGEKTSPFHRRARACPSPGLAQPNDRGGQAPALR